MASHCLSVYLHRSALHCTALHSLHTCHALSGYHITSKGSEHTLSHQLKKCHN